MILNFTLKPWIGQMPSPKIEIIINDSNDVINEIIDIGDFKIGYFNLKNKVSNNDNEDVLFITGNENELLLGVSDGAGGHPKGQEAANIVCKELVKLFKDSSNTFINSLEVVEAANDKVVELKVGAKCTLAYVTIEKDYFRCHSIGDSEIVYWNSVGGEIFSNVPHSSVGYQIKSGALAQDESLDDPERHYVMNLIGDETVRVDSSTKIQLKKGHTILIGTDGLFDNISHDALREIVSKGIFEKSFEELSGLCKIQNDNEWKKDDDIAFIMLRKIKTNI